MELPEAIQILADYAEALPHTPPPIAGGPDDQGIALGFVSFDDCLKMKKAIVVAAGALKSVQDCFGLPADTVMTSIRAAVAGMGQMVEQPGIFDDMMAAKQNQGGEVIDMPARAQRIEIPAPPEHPEAN